MPLRCKNFCQLLQPSTAGTAECITTTSVIESIIRRTIVIVEEKVGGKVINRTINEVSSPGTNIREPFNKCLFFVMFNVKMFLFICCYTDMFVIQLQCVTRVRSPLGLQW